MIKATELQIGDYVLVSGTPRRVESITKKKIGYHINPQTDKRSYYAMLRDVEPIEITKDFLLKNGYRESKPRDFFDAYGKYRDIDVRYLISLYMSSNILSASFYQDDEEGGTQNVGGFSMCQVFYVHTLQQMYRLWGIEIDWKL